MTKIRKHYIIRGRVQGVGFRYKAYHVARAYGLTGYAKNCYDGSVEMELQGTADAIDRFLPQMRSDRWIEIDDIEVRTISVIEDERGFRTL